MATCAVVSVAVAVEVEVAVECVHRNLTEFLEAFFVHNGRVIRVGVAAVIRVV